MSNPSATAVRKLAFYREVYRIIVNYKLNDQLKSTN